MIGLLKGIKSASAGATKLGSCLTDVTPGFASGAPFAWCRYAAARTYAVTIIAAP